MTQQSQAHLLPHWLEAPQWFHDLQAVAADFESIPFKKLERIPYEKWFNVQAQSVQEAMLDHPLTYSLTAGVTATSSAKIVHAGLSTIYQAVNYELSQKGLLVMDLFEALTDHPEKVAQVFGKITPVQSHRIAAYNMAYLNGGIFVYVPENMVIEEPIEIDWVQDNRFDCASHKKLVVYAGKNSQFTLVETMESQGDRANTITAFHEVIAEAGSQIHYVVFDKMSRHNDAYLSRQAVLKDQATLHWSIMAMNDGHSVEDVNTFLNGNNAQSSCSTITIGDGQQKQGVNARITNQGRGSIGHIAQRGVVLDDATVSFNGIGHILKQAKYADSQQESRILMLSSGARGDANPILLIDEFEVQAGHAASIGRVDEEQLYYLMSRGLDRKQAERLVTRGFLGDVLKDLKSSDLRQRMSESLDYKLRHL